MSAIALKKHPEYDGVERIYQRLRSAFYATGVQEAEHVQDAAVAVSIGELAATTPCPRCRGEMLTALFERIMKYADDAAAGRGFGKTTYTTGDHEH